MNAADVVTALSALAQPSRLAAFRRLVQAGPSGLSAGELATALGISPPALSFHLRALTQAGLAGSRQQGRHVYYTADYAKMQSLLDYLTENCCAGDACRPPRRMKRRRA